MNPRYYTARISSGFAIYDRQSTPELIAVLQNEHAADNACADLNRGLVETVTVTGRWWDKEITVNTPGIHTDAGREDWHGGNL